MPCRHGACSGMVQVLSCSLVLYPALYIIVFSRTLLRWSGGGFGGANITVLSGTNRVGYLLSQDTETPF